MIHKYKTKLNRKEKYKKIYKKILLISVFLSMFIFGTILIFTTPSTIKVDYNRTVETKDKEIIYFNVYEPLNGDKNKNAIIIGHGSMVNKEMLKSYAIEIATAGFIVVTLDFRGHGLSTGEIKTGLLVNDVKAVKKYLEERGDVRSHGFGYIGYSMGGYPGNKIVKDDDDFKCFIGIGTSLDLDYDDCKNRKLNILMILAKYDQAFDLRSSKKEIADRLDIDDDDVRINRLYGNFEDGNATKLFVDDNSDHFLTAYDQDFVREARDWVINTFPDANPVDQNFYVNFRPLILILQLIGGIGFFFLSIEPLSRLFVKKKEDNIYNLETGLENETVSKISRKSFIYSMVLAIPGILLIFLTAFLFLPLTMAGFNLALLFGQAFGIFIFLWRTRKKSNLSLSKILIGPFKQPREKLVKEILFGAILSVLLYTILYLSIGLNYLGIIPSLHKFLYIPIYFAIGIFYFIILSTLFQVILQNKFEDNIKGIFKIASLNFALVMVYLITYILLLCLLLGSFFFIIILYIAVPIVALSAFIMAFLYQKTGSILVGAIVCTFFVILIMSTLSPFMLGINYFANLTD